MSSKRLPITIELPHLRNLLVILWVGPGDEATNNPHLEITVFVC